MHSLGEQDETKKMLATMTEGSGRARLLLEAQRERGLTAQEDNVDDLEEELARRHTARSVNRTEQDCFPQQGQGERQGKSEHTLDAHKLWKKARRQRAFSRTWRST